MTPRTHPVHAILGRQVGKGVSHYIASCAVLALGGDGIVANRKMVAAVDAAFQQLGKPSAGLLRILTAPVLKVCRASVDRNEDAFAIARHDLRMALAVYFAGEVRL